MLFFTIKVDIIKYKIFLLELAIADPLADLLLELCYDGSLNASRLQEIFKRITQKQHFIALIVAAM